MCVEPSRTASRPCTVRVTCYHLKNTQNLSQHVSFWQGRAVLNKHVRVPLEGSRTSLRPFLYLRKRQLTLSPSTQHVLSNQPAPPEVLRVKLDHMLRGERAAQMRKNQATETAHPHMVISSSFVHVVTWLLLLLLSHFSHVCATP